MNALALGRWGGCPLAAFGASAPRILESRTGVALYSGSEGRRPVPSRSLLRAFVFLWWTVGLVLLIFSVRTLLGTLAANHHSPLALLACVEAVSALLFLLPQTLRVGAVGLLLTLGVAFIAHLFMKEFRWDLLLDAAAVTFVAVHGTLSGPQWREAALSG